MREPYWKRTAGRAAAWEKVGARNFVANAVRFWIWDSPDAPFLKGEWNVFKDLSYTKEDREFANLAIREGVAGRIFEYVSEGRA